jgi:hypothetical protein
MTPAKRLLSPDTLQAIALSPDNRFIYYNLRKKGVDLFLANAQ